MWWASHEGAGMVQPGKVQPWSRAVMALRMCGGKILVVRPMSRTRLWLPSRMGMMSGSQAILRTVEAVTGPVNVNYPVPGMPAVVVLEVSWPCWPLGVLELAAPPESVPPEPVGVRSGGG